MVRLRRELRQSAPSTHTCYNPSVSGFAIPAVLSRKQALRLADVSPQQLAAWEREQLFPSKEEYTQQDIQLLKNLRVLRQTGIPLGRISTLCEDLHRRLGDQINPLRDVRFEKRGRNLALRWQGHEMDARSGQLLLELAPAEWKAIATFPKKAADKEKPDQRIRAAAAIFQQALEKENQGAPPADVAPLYQQALELDPRCVGAHVNLGTIYFNLRKVRQAEQHYRKAIELQPNYVLAHFNLASLYDEQGKFEKAIEQYRSTLQLDANYVDAHYNLALLLQNLGRTMEATRHWKTFLKLDPSSEWAQIARRELKRLLDSTIVASNGKNARGATRKGVSQAG